MPTWLTTIILGILLLGDTLVYLGMRHRMKRVEEQVEDALAQCMDHEIRIVACRLMHYRLREDFERAMQNARTAQKPQEGLCAAPGSTIPQKPTHDTMES